MTLPRHRQSPRAAVEKDSWTSVEHGRLHLHPSPEVEAEIDICADQPIVISKLFGPAVFADIRVRADLESWCWIVEQTLEIYSEDLSTSETTWQEVARFPAEHPLETDPDLEQIRRELVTWAAEHGMPFETPEERAAVRDAWDKWRGAPPVWRAR